MLLVCVRDRKGREGKSEGYYDVRVLRFACAREQIWRKGAERSLAVGLSEVQVFDPECPEL